MKNLYKFILCFTISTCCAQNAVWYFGKSAGLRFNNIFNTTTEVTDMPLNNGFNDGGTLEGVATVSSLEGLLLFYTNGTEVFSHNHQIMDNGAGLYGHYSSRQNAVIIPRPEHENEFYVITTDVMEQGKGLHYSIVDMSYNGGLGKVITKNTVLKDHLGVAINQTYNYGSYPRTERITTTFNSDGINYWVVTKIKNYIYSYSVTASGISSLPAYYYSLPAENSIYASASQFIKISPYGNKIVITHSDNTLGIAYKLGDFNPATGQISNVNVNITKNSSDEFSMGIEFSGNNQNLYFLLNNSFDYSSNLYKYNIQTSEKTLISTTTSNQVYMQRAANGKIYIPSGGSTKISEISTPDNFSNPNYSFQNITLSRNVNSGLPQWVYWHNSGGFCQPLYLTSEPNFSYNYSFNKSITTYAGYTINSGQTITMSATDFISLEPDTYIGEGSEYWAILGSCLTPRPKNNDEIPFDLTETKNTEIEEFILFPNPSNDIVNLYHQQGIKILTVVSIDGKVIYSTTINGDKEYILDVKSFSKGIYLINIQGTDGKIFTEKLIVE
ncbi:T9SS type A sorting domain-containing protein [Flavobacterium salilacus subsp. salilacus]|uniref:T9SS type A sorting domain-containing protein n=1 Tax=Flavobacterium TaxID=237 RepID=UPI001074D119|nr:MULTISPECIES: T9SS type A sorting domain-containing protein [Flavobacterium]KAF2520102.1 T9SS type A sorting domain-containing protein [Flavobacterium salilacus subsp. salilacus]MBE1613982.1 T9SS type A sorting domain-containing protein [Flavobacterium sp. SaA2.13]